MFDDSRTRTDLVSDAHSSVSSNVSSNVDVDDPIAFLNRVRANVSQQAADTSLSLDEFRKRYDTEANPRHPLQDNVPLAPR